MSRKNISIILIDENEIVAEAIRGYLVANGYRVIKVLRSVSDLNKDRNEVVFLNLSYDRNYQSIVNTINRILPYDFAQLLVLSELCLYGGCPEVDDKRVTVLCRRGLRISGRPESIPRPIWALCNQRCDESKTDETGKNRPWNDKIQTLSAREKEILGLIGLGYSSKEIGLRLYISKRTVDCHRTNIIEKTHLSGLSELIRFAIYFRDTFTA